MRNMPEHAVKGFATQLEDAHPAADALAPLKGTIKTRGQASASDYYPRALSLTSIAGIRRLPQVSLLLAESRGVLVGLSLLATGGRDAFLLSVAKKIAP
jgi:Asp-tRNA(Asn)/Glu-tRNA(Gln) amidotransferase A subunit family amidase